MNIVFHHRTRGRGAEGAHIRGVVKGLRELDHEVVLLSMPGASPEEKSDSLKRKGRSGHDTLRFLTDLTQYAPEFLFEIFELLYNIIPAIRLGKAASRHEADIIYERYSLFMFAGVWIAKRRGLPCILEVNDSCLVSRVRPLFFRRIARGIERWIFRNATGLVFISNRFREIVRNEYGLLPASVVSPNAADLDVFKVDHVSSTKLRQKLGIDDQTVVGYVGAFVHWHGIDWFVKGITKRLREFPSLTLLLVGDGVCFEPIRNLVQQEGLTNQVLMPGRVPHSEISAYIGAMDYGVLPDSNEYGSPMKLFEFMASAKAMVAPDFPPIAEVVRDNNTGWLFPARDRDACINRVLGLVNSRDEYQRVGNNARKFIENERQWRHNAEQLLSLVSDSVRSS